jgi:ribonuclease HI
VTLFLDSEYVRKGITEWIQGWKAQAAGARRRRQPVKNADLWQRLDALAPRRRAPASSWRWVKGHAGDPRQRARGSNWPIRGEQVLATPVATGTTA